jgi:hypothetical protein
MKNTDDYKESPTMREIHQIQDELEQQYQKSGLSYLEWLEATEDEFQKALAKDGFHTVTRNGEIFIEEIKPKTTRTNSKYRAPVSSSGSKAAKHKNFDDYIEDSTMRELHLIREKMEQEYQKSGLPSYWDWLQATEKDWQKKLEQDGFRVIKRGDRMFLQKIESQSKNRVKYKHKGVSKRNKTASRKKSTK